MKKLVAIVAGEPNSINSEIIAKAWKKINNKKKLFIIGNYSLLKKQLNSIGIKAKITEINSSTLDIDKKSLNILNIPFKFKSIFPRNSSDVKNYVLKSLDVAHNLASKKKIVGFINAPVDKKIFGKKYLGVTEYLANKNNVRNKETMLIFNKKLSVMPLTTHLEIKNVTNNIKPNLIKIKILTLNKHYFRIFKRIPNIAILGLNPHNSENRLNSIENKIIKPAIKKLKKLRVNINGPYSADTIFNNQKKLNYNVIVGMYHDQVLAPFKALYGFDAINITLGLHYIRISPDHGTAQDIIGLNKANPQSLISAINFLNKIND
ncbi:4-hydroxythreonine-4-phosphate dehydrogenase PdxA [Pelagibacteraceae bacterium]|nr:4-hydroxythreonine-4-phosphate dehydrogenase PdxA [Pelagibacteraceae bacterium]